MNRPDMVARLEAHQQELWDLIVIGGGATGAGVAVDAASRGYRVLLLEQHDFGKGTSSRSTKLVHGGVRYLEQGNIHLVREALHERGYLLRNAPHLVHDLPFILPTYKWWEGPFYSLGLKVYDFLAGGQQFGSSRYLHRRKVIDRVPTIQTRGLHGGVEYHDGQFDDARLLINLLQTASSQGTVVLNYAQVVRLLKNGDTVNGVVIQDHLEGKEWTALGRVVINATGAFCDRVRHFADPASAALIAPSQGSHLVFNRSFLPTDTALIVPHTSDGRVLFVIPWHGHVLVGTTDVAIPKVTAEPRATPQEIDFILETAGRYLAKPPTGGDVLAVFVGIRPLVKAAGSSNTAALSRDHTIRIDPSGLLTITGGKWTTYRNMAEDCVDQAAKMGHLPIRKCVTKTLRIHGWHQDIDPTDPLASYGSDADGIRQLQEKELRLATRLHPDLPYTGAEVVWAVENEMAITLEDVLARRTRALFLNASVAQTMAPIVAAMMAKQLGKSSVWEKEQIEAFRSVAAGFMLPGLP